MLEAGSYLTSPNGRVRLTMQHDGNLVIYCRRTRNVGFYQPIWSTNTWQISNSIQKAVFTKAGSIALFDSTGTKVFDTWSGGQGGGKLVLQDDGDLVIYTNYNEAVWSTTTALLKWTLCG